MTIAPQWMSLSDYLDYEDDTDTCYELRNGALRAVPPESEVNRRIVVFLLLYFAQLGVPFSRLTMKTELAVIGPGPTVHLPDVMLLSEELAQVLEGATRSTVLLDMPPPQLVIEVVSPGKKNQDRDYRHKRSQYEARGVEEYWIVDPLADRVTVLVWMNGLYEERAFVGNEQIMSALLETVELTVEVLLRAGKES